MSRVSAMGSFADLFLLSSLLFSSYGVTYFFFFFYVPVSLVRFAAPFRPLTVLCQYCLFVDHSIGVFFSCLCLGGGVIFGFFFLFVLPVLLCRCTLLLPGCVSIWCSSNRRVQFLVFLC